MNREEVRQLVVEALHQTANVFNNPAVTDRLRDPDGDVRLDEMQLDSLDLVEWSVAIENRTGLVIDPGEMAGAAQLSDIVAFVHARHSAGE